MTLPKLVGLHRVIVFKILDGDPEKFNPELLFAHIVNFSEVRIRHGCSYSDIVVYDFSLVKIAHVLKVSLPLLKKLQTVAEVSRQ